MEINNLQEAKQVGPAMLVTGALNPYTRAHEEMAGMAMQHAHKTGHTHFYHGIGSSELKPDAPLTHEQKTKLVTGSHRYLRRKYKLPVQTGVIPRESSVSPFHQIAHLIGRGHKDITIALGSDQLAQGGLKSQIEAHMKKHGGFLGSDKKPHQVNIKFHQLGGTRHEGDMDRAQIMREVAAGNLRTVKAGRLRGAVQSGDFELASAMMPESIKNKKGYFTLIAKQQKAVADAAAKKKVRKKKLTECFSAEKIEEFSKLLNEAQLVRGMIEQRKNKRLDVMNKMKQQFAKVAAVLMQQQRTQKATVGSSPALSQQHKAVRQQERQGFLNNMRSALQNVKMNFAGRIIKAKKKEIDLGLDIPPRRVGNPQEPKKYTTNEEMLNEARKRGVASPSKVMRKTRTEIRASGNSKNKDTIRKQDERRDEKKSAKFAVVVGTDKKIKIVKKEDIGKSKVILEPDKFDKSKAKKYLEDPTFEITDSSKKLFPEFKRQKSKSKGPKGNKKKKKKKQKNKQQKVTDKNPREVLPALPKTPKGGKERTTPKSQYPDFDHTSLDLEAAIPVLLNKMMKTSVDPTLMDKIGDKIKVSKTLAASAQRAAQAIVEQFGEVVSVHMGAAKTKITPLWTESGGTDSTPKTDILLVPKKIWEKAKGDVSKIDMSQAFRCSMKVGEARIINAESGEAAATVEAALQTAGDIASKNKKVKGIVKEIKEAMLKFAKSAELGQFSVDDIRDMIATGEEPDDPNFKKYVKLIKEQDKLKDFVAQKFREVFDTSKEFRLAILRESFTGVAKFGEKSPACATHCLAMTKDGSNVGIEEISDDFLEEILPDLVIRGAFKGRSREVKQPSGKKIKLRGFSTLFNIDYKRKVIREQQEQQVQQEVESIQPTENLTFPGASQIVKNELDQIGDNFGLLMEYSELEPTMLTSNAIDLTDYVNMPARAYNTIIIDGTKTVTVPVYDFEKFEQQQQEIESMNENALEFINDFITENAENEEALDLMLSSGLIAPQSINSIVTKLKLDFNKSAYSDLLNEMWETSILRPDLFKRFLNEARDYKKEYKDYHSKPEQRSNRSKRVLARRKLMKKGRVRKGDGKDVHHEDGNPQNNGDSNLKVLSKSKNRAIKEEHGAGEVGTDELRKKYIQDTPFAIDPLKVLRGVVKNGIRRK